jgi:alpha-D-ribose 1-methylphosphonate 5-triphosphate synthase subunit PhnH
VSALFEAAFNRVFDTQNVYRRMLDAIARPGKVAALPRLDICPPPGLSAYASGLAFTLLDAETTFAVLPANEAWQDYLAVNTGARTAAPADAEFIILAGDEYGPQITAARRGDLLAPERGATIFALVGAIDTATGGDLRLTLAGPGVDGRKTVFVTGLSVANLENILSLNQEYPLGVDCFLTDRHGRLVAMPRSTAVQWEVIS